jgi:hypothetical protein
MIIQLLNNTEKLLREARLTGKGKIEFPLLEPGKYRIRSVFDLNGDGKWTTGDFDIHRQPEPVSYYPAELDIRANWEATQPWNLEPVNFKNPEMQIIKKSTR